MHIGGALEAVGIGTEGDAELLIFDVGRVLG